MVYINRRNVKTKRPSNKLDHIRIGPFPITDVLGNVTYKVKLPIHMKIHPVFHVSRLEPAKGKQKHPIAPPLSKDNKEVEWDLEEII